MISTVLFACVHNAGRSQMAEAIFNLHADPRKARAISAGTNPTAQVHPVVIEAMHEYGVDLASRVPQRLTDALARHAQWLITMGCGDECPIVPGVRRDDWPIQDPKDQPLDRVRAIKDDIEQRVKSLIAAQGWERDEGSKGSEGSGSEGSENPFEPEPLEPSEPLEPLEPA